MSCWIKREAVLILFLILCGVPRNLIARDIVLSTDLEYSIPVRAGDLHGISDVTRACDVTAAALGRRGDLMTLFVLDRIDYTVGAARRIHIIKYEDKSRIKYHYLMPLPPSKRPPGGVPLSPPGDGLLALSPDALYCGVYYEQQDDPILDHYHFVLTRPGVGWMEKRIWTPNKTERRQTRAPLPDSWVARWMEEKQLMLNYAATSQAGDAILVFDQYDFDRTVDEWKRTTKPYPISLHLDVMADHYSIRDNSLALIGYHDLLKENREWPPFNSPAKRILWKIDLEKESTQPPPSSFSRKDSTLPPIFPRCRATDPPMVEE
jgi:hypothetical protein